MEEQFILVDSLDGLNFLVQFSFSSVHLVLLLQQLVLPVLQFLLDLLHRHQKFLLILRQNRTIRMKKYSNQRISC